MSAEINYRITTALLRASRLTRFAPIGGVLDSAIIHWPAGCNSLVEIFINHGTNQVLPAPATGGTQGNLGLALDDITQSFDINLAIIQGAPLEVVVINHDEINSHTISVILKVSDIKTYTGP